MKENPFLREASLLSHLARGRVKLGRMDTDDPFELNRFVSAQEGTYERAAAELQRGRKVTHWMWFIFPQFDGLGSSATARHYSIKSRDEVRAYLDHPLLGPRLVACTEILLHLEGKTAHEIFGFPDDVKLRSSLTLFAVVSGDPGSVFSRALAKYFAGEPDPQTIKLIQ